MDPAKLRFFKGPIAARGVILGTIISGAITLKVVFWYRRTRVNAMKEFYKDYDEKAEWKSLLESGILKTVTKDGKFKNMSD
ncbi:hypothetical protein FBUS_11657 [Fasciolopsis buskii]|uniref:Mitochondrial cytochrome c oxidase subunit VIc/VIIs domain-containing protein n=1 Tax=Fasciolopsis buskii TaxID=27845 RepID=A0A8E0VGR2_9TREM|nr:hypothetical protein FBUS_11657 [Fasciolopsis buski]